MVMSAMGDGFLGRRDMKPLPKRLLMCSSPGMTRLVCELTGMAKVAESSETSACSGTDVPDDGRFFFTTTRTVVVGSGGAKRSVGLEMRRSFPVPLSGL